MSRIRLLSSRLANQIAAGEVVERPASVAKELLENSLDAGASRVEVEVESGGARLIRIRDDGIGIPSADMTLALARHATSKITSLEDLEEVGSLGFRGEALASIGSVSRLVLTSNNAEEGSEGCSAVCEGREMEVQIKPAAHPRGTTVEVRDLFFNTPARRKFLRTEKTEFGHLEEVLKRLALSRFDVAFNLRHNGKAVHSLKAATTLVGAGASCRLGVRSCLHGAGGGYRIGCLSLSPHGLGRVAYVLPQPGGPAVFLRERAHCA